MLNRRGFTAAMTAGLAGAAPGQGRAPGRFILAANGWMPNNPHLSVLHLRGVLPVGGADPAV